MHSTWSSLAVHKTTATIPPPPTPPLTHHMVQLVVAEGVYPKPLPFPLVAGVMVTQEYPTTAPSQLQVHLSKLRSSGDWSVLVQSIQNLLFGLRDSVCVQQFDGDDLILILHHTLHYVHIKVLSQ